MLVAENPNKTTTLNSHVHSRPLVDGCLAGQVEQLLHRKRPLRLAGDGLRDTPAAVLFLSLDQRKHAD
jgi:hypothetical protein